MGWSWRTYPGGTQQSGVGHHGSHLGTEQALQGERNCIHTSIAAAKGHTVDGDTLQEDVQGNGANGGRGHMEGHAIPEANRPARTSAAGVQPAGMGQHAGVVAVVSATQRNGGAPGARAQRICGAPLSRGPPREPADGIGQKAASNLWGHGSLTR